MAEAQGYMKQFRMPGWPHPVWFPRGVDNTGHLIFAPPSHTDTSILPVAGKTQRQQEALAGEEDTMPFSSPGADGGAGRGPEPLVPVETRSSVDGVLDVQLNVVAASFSCRGIRMTTRSYNGSFPGPVLRVKRGDLLKITIKNELMGKSDEPFWSSPEHVAQMNVNVNATNLHLHGLHIAPRPYNASLGSCGDNIRCVVPPTQTLVFEHRIPHNHPSGTYWYHPHGHGTTALQVGGLMAGALIVEDDARELSAPLARMPEQVLVIQMLYFKSIGVVTHDTIVQQLRDDQFSHYEGPRENTVLVNGQRLPSAALRRKQALRLRIINANEVANFELVVRGCTTVTVAYDGVYLDRPLREEVVVLPPGGRADMILVCAHVGEYWLESDPDPIRGSFLGHHARIRARMIRFVVTENGRLASAASARAASARDRSQAARADSRGDCVHIGAAGCGKDLGLGRLPPRPSYLTSLTDAPMPAKPFDLKMSEGQGPFEGTFYLNDQTYSASLRSPAPSSPSAASGPLLPALPRTLTLGQVDEVVSLSLSLSLSLSPSLPLPPFFLPSLPPSLLLSLPSTKNALRQILNTTIRLRGARLQRRGPHTHTHTYTHTHTCTHTCTHAHAHTHMHTHTCTCIHV